ncbi:unnamed protein product, partial [Prunus brigantina]
GTVGFRRKTSEIVSVFDRNSKLSFSLLRSPILTSEGCAAIAQRVLSNSTFSNLVGPMEEVCFYGHQLLTLLLMFMATHMEALHMHFQSYVDKMTICLAVDPDAIPDPNKLLDDLEESLKLIRDAVVVEKGLTMEAAV